MVAEDVKIRVIRAMIGCDRKTFAAKFGLRSPNTVTNWEHGKTTLQAGNRKVLNQICMDHNIAFRPDGFPVPGVQEMN